MFRRQMLRLMFRALSPLYHSLFRTAPRTRSLRQTINAHELAQNLSLVQFPYCPLAQLSLSTGSSPNSYARRPDVPHLSWNAANSSKYLVSWIMPFAPGSHCLDRNHLNKHTRYSCKECPISYPHRKSLWDHEQKVHHGVMHACNIADCTYSAAKRSNLRRHQDKQHGHQLASNVRNLASLQRQP